MPKPVCIIKDCKKFGVYFSMQHCGWLCSLHYDEYIKNKIKQSQDKK
jgi:hypothetical protein